MMISSLAGAASLLFCFVLFCFVFHGQLALYTQWVFFVLLRIDIRFAQDDEVVQVGLISSIPAPENNPRNHELFHLTALCCLSSGGVQVGFCTASYPPPPPHRLPPPHPARHAQSHLRRLHLRTPVPHLPALQPPQRPCHRPPVLERKHRCCT